MAKPLHIHIPEPCHQNWQNMTPSEQGAFCKSCSKNVIDFSYRTENEIYEILAKSDAGVCGRFTKQQLAQPIRKTEIRKSFFQPKAIAASILAFFSAGKMEAATDVVPDTLQIEQPIIDSATTETCAEDTCEEPTAADSGLVNKNTAIDSGIYSTSIIMGDYVVCEPEYFLGFTVIHTEPYDPLVDLQTGKPLPRSKPAIMPAEYKVVTGATFTYNNAHERNQTPAILATRRRNLYQ